MDHEGWDQPVEGRIVVGVRGAQREEVESCFGTGLAIQFELERAVGGMECDGHDCRCRRYLLSRMLRALCPTCSHRRHMKEVASM